MRQQLGKKLLVMMLIGVLSFGMTACGTGGEEYENHQIDQKVDEGEPVNADHELGNFQLTSVTRELTDIEEAITVCYDYDPTASSWPESWKKLNQPMKDFAVELFRRNASAEGNFMVSPISIMQALAMVETGAGGETLKQLEDAFGLSLDNQLFWMHVWKDRLFEEGDPALNVANALWFNEASGFQPEVTFLQTLKGGNFNADVFASDFSADTVKDINGWCREETRGMINNIINSLDPTDALFLANAVAFENQWSDPYEDYQIKQEPFTNEAGEETEADMMYSEEHIFLRDDLATGFRKYYEGNYSFVAILPNEGTAVADYLKQLDGERFDSFLHSAEKAPVTVHAVLPAFTSSYTAGNLTGVLADLGVTDLFSPEKADLTGMGDFPLGNVFVKDVIHKTFIDVDAKGTRAAAVTGIKCGATAAMLEQPKEYTVRLDRPFIYAIIDNYTETPLFMGTMMDVD